MRFMERAKRWWSGDGGPVQTAVQPGTYEGPLCAGQEFRLRGAEGQGVRVIAVVYCEPRIVEYVLVPQDLCDGVPLPCVSQEDTFRRMVLPVSTANTGAH